MSFRATGGTILGSSRELALPPGDARSAWKPIQDSRGVEPS